MLSDSLTQGDFKKAVEYIEYALPDCPVEFESEVLAMARALKAGQIPKLESKTPIYRRLNTPIHFFRHFDEDLPASWRDSWQYRGLE